MSVETAPTDKKATEVLRWIALVPGAIVSSIAVRFIAAVLLGVASAPRALALSVYLFVAAAVFVWAGATIAPTGKRKTAITLCSVYFFAMLAVEMFRVPEAAEPPGSLSHLAPLASAAAGALAGLTLSLLQIKHLADAQLTPREAGGRL